MSRKVLGVSDMARGLSGIWGVCCGTELSRWRIWGVIIMGVAVSQVDPNRCNRSPHIPDIPPGVFYASSQLAPRSRSYSSLQGKA